MVSRVQVMLSHAVVRHSSTDGIWIGDDGLTSTVELRHIVENAGEGIRSGDRTAIVLAPNNWWGAASGPMSACNPGGTGRGVIAAVAFRTFLAAGFRSRAAGAR